MKLGCAKYRMMQQMLDEAGLCTSIIRVGPKWYQLQLNGEVIKKYKQRHSCNKKIERMYQDLISQR